MPKKNKTVCKRRKCQRSRRQRRPRTIRRGGWPSCWPSCWRSSNRVAPTTSDTSPSTDSRQQLPRYNTIASVAHGINEAAHMVGNSVADRNAKRDQANIDLRTKRAEDEAERLEQQALRDIALRKLHEAKRIQDAAKRQLENTKRITQRSEHDIAAAQKKLDAAVQNVPSHMQGAVARGRWSPGSD